MTGNSPSAGSSRQLWRWKILICLMLALVTTAVYLPVRHYEFINFDDNLFVTLNPHLRNGLSREAVDWSFAVGMIRTSPNADYWRPLSYLSHALDIEMFGFRPGEHHLMSLAIHLAATISLFWVLNLMTGALWRSAFVAGLFALHPLHVESVAWIAERKDVLSGLFFILTLGAYTGYSRSPSASRYLLVLGLFVLALMSKPIVVTLPFVLLLLDYWPLRRLAGSLSAEEYYCANLRSQFPIETVRRLVVEKLPFFLLAIGSSIFAFHSQKAIGAALLLDLVPLRARIENALVSYAVYILNLFWPVKLAMFYPYHIDLPVWQVAGALAFLAGITILVLVAARRCPWLPVGWCWYLGMLLPVIGILQVGAQARADRYTYLSFIGLFLMITWTVGELCPPWRHRKLLLGALMTIVLGVLTACTSIQVSYWRDSESLWTHTLACTSDNYMGHNNLALALVEKGRVDEAVAQYQTALQINPSYAEIHYNFGIALFQKGRVDEAISRYQTALQLKPDYAAAHINLGIALLQKGDVDEAIAHFQIALQINPDSAEAHNNLGSALLKMGKVDEAIIHYRAALQIKPDNAEACYNLGNVLFQKGSMDEAIAYFQKVLRINPDDAEACCKLGSALCQKGRANEAITHYQKVLQIKPDSPDVLNNLAWLLATCPDAHVRDGVQAVKYAEHACELTHHDVTLLVGTLAAAYAEAGRYDDAITAAQKACALATAAGQRELFERNQELLVLYRAHQPYHEPAKEFVPAAP